MPHVLAPHEDGRPHEEGHRVVLERAAVPVAHQVVDQPRRPLGVGVDVLERLLARRRDPGREDDVGIGGTGAHQLDGHVAAEGDLLVLRHARHPIDDGPGCRERRLGHNGPMPESGVRLARTSDVDGIADVNVRSWRQRFATTLPARGPRRDGPVGPRDGVGQRHPQPAHDRATGCWWRSRGSDVVGYAAIGPEPGPGRRAGRRRAAGPRGRSGAAAPRARLAPAGRRRRARPRGRP